MLGRLSLAGSRVPSAVFVGTALMVCFAVTACVGYQAQKDATIVVVTNVYSASDGSQPANEITKSIIQELQGK